MTNIYEEILKLTEAKNKKMKAIEEIDLQISTLEEELTEKVIDSGENFIDLGNNLIWSRKERKSVDTDKFIENLGYRLKEYKYEDVYKECLEKAKSTRITTSRAKLIKSLKDQLEASENINIKEVIKHVEELNTTTSYTYGLVDLEKK